MKKFVKMITVMVILFASVSAFGQTRASVSFNLTIPSGYPTCGSAKCQILLMNLTSYDTKLADPIGVKIDGAGTYSFHFPAIVGYTEIVYTKATFYLDHFLDGACPTNGGYCETVECVGAATNYPVNAADFQVGCKTPVPTDPLDTK